MRITIKPSRHPQFKNQNQRRKFTSRFQRKVKDFYDTIALNEMLEEEEGYSQEPQDSNFDNPPLMPIDIQNHITQTPTIETFIDGRREYKAVVPATLLHTTHPNPTKFYQKSIIKFDQEETTYYHSILNQSIN